MKSYNIGKELYRIYEWTDPISGNQIKHTVNRPVILFYESGHSCHRVVDANDIVHCVPAVGYFGCIVYWENADKDNPVNF